MDAIFLAVAIAGLAVFLGWYYSRRYDKCPPGPLGLPILGSLLSMDAEKPHHSLTNIAKQFGKDGACQLYLGSIRTVLLTDPKLIREAFAKEEFSGRAPLFLTHGIMKGQGIICAEGELWKDQRRLLSAWLRSMGAAKTSPTRDSLENKVSKKLDVMVDSLMSRSAPIILPDVQRFLADYLGNLVSEIVHGVSFHEDNETWKWLLHIQEEGVKAMGVAAIVNFLPFIRFISKSTQDVMECITSGQMQTHTIYRSIIELKRNRKRKRNGEDVSEKEERIRCVHYEIQKHGKPKSHYFSTKDLIIGDEDSILDYYLDEQAKRVSSDPNGLAAQRLSDTQLVFLLADLFGAGLDTTLLTLSWFLLFVALHKDEQEKIRSELRTQCGSRNASLSDLPYLPYTRAAFSETQRIRSVVPIGIPHGCTKDTMLGKYLIKKGTMVVPLQWALHMDNAAWEEPAEFKPSRFTDADGSILNPAHFIPFQTGKRMCPGDELARIILFMFGTRLIQRFHLELNEPYPSLDGVMGLTMGPPPFQLTLRPVEEHTT